MRHLTIVLMLTAAAAFLAQAEEVKSGYDAHGQRDPFEPLITAKGESRDVVAGGPASELVLEGIILDGQGGQAIVNGEVLEPGKTLGEYTVQKIEPDRVVLMKDGQEIELRLKKEE